MNMLEAMTQDLKEAIMEAPDLDSLLEALRALEDEIARQPAGSPLADERVDTIVNIESIPVFDSEGPADTFGVWSWDSKRLLVGEGSWAAARLIARDDR